MSKPGAKKNTDTQEFDLKDQYQSLLNSMLNYENNVRHFLAR